MNKGRSTQKLVNAYPLWSNTRSDEQSLGFQILNITGNKLDDAAKQSSDQRDNFYITTANVRDIDLFYKLQLPSTFEFTKENFDDSGLEYTPPSVSGYIDSTAYSVDSVEDNTVESFWYKSVPSRLSLEDISDLPYIIASGQVSESPLRLVGVSGLLHSPNKLTIRIDGGTSYIELSDNNVIRKGILQIEGVNREGIETTEELTFLYDEARKSLNEYKSIVASGVKVYGITEAEDTHVKVLSADFMADSYQDPYQIDTSLLGTDMPVFWAIGSGITGNKTLDLKTFETDDFDLIINGFTDKVTILQQDLLTTAGTSVDIRDISPEPHTDNIWAVDSGTIYLYSSKLPYPNMSKATLKQYDATSVIEPNTYYAVLNDEVEINYVWKRPIKGLVAHRTWVEKPNGNKYSLESGSEVTYHTDSSSWIYGEPQKRVIKAAEYFTLDQYGDYIFTLEVKYTDETTSIDQRIVSTIYQEALGEYQLFPLGITESVEGIDIDSDGKIWVLGESGSSYSLDRHYDNMLIDFDNKILYFREPYTKVKVY